MTKDYRSLAATISADVDKLTAASERLQDQNDDLQDQNDHLCQRVRKTACLRQAMLALVLFLAGGLCGIYMEKRQTTNILINLATGVERIQTLGCTGAH